MSLPIHRWYRYTAGFSALWVRELLKEESLKGRSRIIDPFAGSGTVLIESEFQNLEARGIEAQPYIQRIAKAKLSWNENIEDFKLHSQKLLEYAKKLKPAKYEYNDLINQCYPPEILERLDNLKRAFIKSKGSETIMEFNWFIITSILRITSPVGTAQWQYVQPDKKKANFVDPYDAFQNKLDQMISDMQEMQKMYPDATKAFVNIDDARKITSIDDNWGDLVITSPPYANNYDYADATRLEMSFWGDITGWKNLQEVVSIKLVRACSQHVAGMKSTVEEYLNDPVLKPIVNELSDVYEQLGSIRLTKGGKKNYHFMIVSYFKDLADTFVQLRRVTSSNAKMCFVIGDSAPYGIYVPVDEWLGTLAIGAGFNDFEFEKLRDRNIKWKNRKHRVPLKEGRLWIN